MNLKLSRQHVISSCTQRLMAIQKQLLIQEKQLKQRKKEQQLQRMILGQVQNKSLKQLQHQRRKQQNIRLEQELISSAVMRKQAHRRLVQEQCLLIGCLMQQLYELSLANNTKNILLDEIQILQQRYLQLNNSKVADEQTYCLVDLKDRQEYESLIEQLPTVRNQAIVQYQLLVKYKERNSITKQLLKQKNDTHQTISTQGDQIARKNNQIREGNNKLSAQIATISQQNIQCSRNISEKEQQNQLNIDRVRQLQQEIIKYKQSHQQLIHVYQSAQNDNLVLRQQLQEKLQSMKKKQSVYLQLNKKKEHLQSKLKDGKRHLNQIINTNNNEVYNIRLEGIEMKREQLISRLVELGIEQEKNDRELNEVHGRIKRLINQKEAMFKQRLELSEELQTKSYFIEQYLTLNWQLMREMHILLSEQISNKDIKQVLYSKHIRRVLMLAEQQLKSIELTHRALPHKHALV